MHVIITFVIRGEITFAELKVFYSISFADLFILSGFSKTAVLQFSFCQVMLYSVFLKQKDYNVQSFDRITCKLLSPEDLTQETVDTIFNATLEWDVH